MVEGADRDVMSPASSGSGASGQGQANHDAIVYWGYLINNRQ